MILDIREFDSFPAEKQIVGDSGCLQIDYQSIIGVKKLRVDLNIQKTGEEYFCQGIVDAVLDVECSRCLTSFEFACDNQIDFIVCDEKPIDENEDVLDAEDYAFFIGGDLRADVSDILRQSLILALPLKPLCSEECKGLCTQCGINLNEQKCSCTTEHIDPRWEALQKLAQRTTENKELS